MGIGKIKIEVIFLVIGLMLVSCKDDSPQKSALRSFVDNEFDLSNVYITPDGSINCSGRVGLNTLMVKGFDEHLNLIRTTIPKVNGTSTGKLTEHQLKNGNWLLAQTYSDSLNQNLKLLITDPEFKVLRSKIIWSKPKQTDSITSVIIHQLTELQNNEIAVSFDTLVYSLSVNGVQRLANTGHWVHTLSSDLTPVFSVNGASLGNPWASPTAQPLIALDNSDRYVILTRKFTASREMELYVRTYNRAGEILDGYVAWPNTAQEPFGLVSISVLNQKILLSFLVGGNSKVNYGLLDIDNKEFRMKEVLNYVNVPSLNKPMNVILPNQGHIMYLSNVKTLYMISVNDNLDITEDYPVPTPSDVQSTLDFKQCYTEEGVAVVATKIKRSDGNEFLMMYKFDKSGNVLIEGN